MTAATHQNYRADIDGLRAVAILLVAVFHFRLLPMGEAGFIGVDIFFVISGYLITGLLMRDLAAGRMSLGRFYLARLRRLLPALVVTLALYFLAASFVFLPEQFAELSREALLTQLYVVNIYFWRTMDYFGLHVDKAPLLHMWSLAVEEQFYLLYPLLLAALFRAGRAVVLPAVALVTLCSFLLGLWATSWKPEASFYLLPTRAWELGAGAILALLPPRPSGAVRLRALAGVLGAALIVLALVIHTPLTAFPGWFAALPVAGAALLMLSGPASPTGRLLSVRPALWIGWISYPFYLVHWPIIQLMRAALPEVTLWHRWAGFAAAILLSWIIWRYAEQPLRFGTLLRRPRALVLGSAAVTGALAAVALSGMLTNGFPARIPAEARAVLAYADDLPVGFAGCAYSARSPGDAPCPLGLADTPVTVAVIGDSHAQALAGALDLWLREAGRAGQLWFHSGCKPVVGASDRDCTGFLEAALAAVGADEEITQVLLVSAWRHNPGVYDGAYLEGAAADAAFASALGRTVARLAGPQRQIVLVDPMFSAPAPVPERLAQNLFFHRDLPVDIPAADHAATFAALHGIFDRAAQRPDVTRISLIADLCATGICQATLDGKPLFTDGNHLRFGVSGYFAERLAKAVSLARVDADDD